MSSFFILISVLFFVVIVLNFVVVSNATDLEDENESSDVAAYVLNIVLVSIGSVFLFGVLFMAAKNVTITNKNSGTGGSAFSSYFSSGEVYNSVTRFYDQQDVASVFSNKSSFLKIVLLLLVVVYLSMNVAYYSSAAAANDNKKDDDDEDHNILLVSNAVFLALVLLVVVYMAARIFFGIEISYDRGKNEALF